MPLQGHWETTNTPLRRLGPRERRATIAVLAVTIVGMLALILATVGDTEPPIAAGCFKTNVAGRTGGETVKGCGAEASQICARATTFEDSRAETVVAACREAGIKF
jgi:hypothetical protein